MAEFPRCCMCNKAGMYYLETGSPSIKEYLCQNCAIINDEIEQRKKKNEN